MRKTACTARPATSRTRRKTSCGSRRKAAADRIIQICKSPASFMPIKQRGHLMVSTLFLIRAMRRSFSNALLTVTIQSGNYHIAPMHATDNTASPQNAAQQPMQLEIDHVAQLYENGEHAQMESATRALLERYPASAFAWSVLSMALQLQGKDALPALHKTVDLAPDDAEAHLHLGNAQLAIGQLDLAVGSYVRALEIQPAFTEAFSRLGDALQAQGHLTEAADCYREVLKMDPAHAAAHMGLGDILQLQYVAQAHVRRGMGGIHFQHLAIAVGRFREMALGL